MMKALLIVLLAIVAVQADSSASASATGSASGSIVVNHDNQNMFAGLNGALSTKVKLIAGTRYALGSDGGFQVLVDVNANCTVYFQTTLQLTVGLPAGWSTVNIGGVGLNFGFGLVVDVQGALNNVWLQSPAIPLFGQQITDDINAGALALDSSTGTNIFSFLHATYDNSTQRITIALPSSLPIVLFGKVQSHVTATLGTAFSTIAGANQTITWDADTSITFRSNVANKITVVKANAATQGSVAAQAVINAGRPLGKFLDISLAVQAAHESTIRISYNNQDLINAGIQNAADLKLAYFNNLTNSWDFGDWETTVNEVEMWIEANVPHFSQWAAFEVSAAVAVPGTQLISNVAINLDILNGALAAKVNLTGGVKYTLATAAGFQLVVDVAADTKLWIALTASFSGLPTGWNQLALGNIGLNVGLKVYVSAQGALNSIYFQSPPIPLFGQEIANGFNAGALAVDQAIGTPVPVFSALQATYDPNTQRITITLPNNLPAIVFVKVQSHVAASFGSAYSCIAGANQTIDWDANTAITFRSNVANTITVIKTNVATKGAATAILRAGRPLGVYLNITLATEASHQSTIRITYNGTDLINAGIRNEADLKLAFYNEATGSWDFGNGQWTTIVNVVGHYVEATVPHFSVWAPIEAPSTGSSTGPNVNGASQASVSIVLLFALIAALFQ